MLSRADEVKGKIGENLRAAIPTLPLSYQLATIKLDVELEQDIDELTIADADKPELKKLLKRYEFKAWLNELEGGKATTETTAPAVPAAPKVESRDYQMVTTQAELDAWFAKIKKAGVLAIDTETTSINYMDARIVGLSFAVDMGEACLPAFGT